MLDAGAVGLVTAILVLTTAVVNFLAVHRQSRRLEKIHAAVQDQQAATKAITERLKLPS